MGIKIGAQIGAVDYFYFLLLLITLIICFPWSLDNLVHFHSDSIIATGQFE